MYFLHSGHYTVHDTLPVLKSLTNKAFYKNMC